MQQSLDQARLLRWCRVAWCSGHTARAFGLEPRLVSLVGTGLAPLDCGPCLKTSPHSLH
jgi:hypothetical protein